MKKRAFTIAALLFFGFSIITPSLSLASSPTIRSSGLVDYTPNEPEPQPNGRLHVHGNYIKNEAGQIVKFRGTSFAPDIMFPPWGGKASQQQVQYLHDWGFNHIKLWVDIGRWNEDAESAVAWENYAQNVVDWASDLGVYTVILGCWWEEGAAMDTRDWTWQWDVLNSYWDTFADKFQDEPYVLYDLMNEPKFTSASAGVSAYQGLVDLVRGYSNTICIVEAISVSGWYEPGLEPFLTDPIEGGNILYSSHHFWWPSYGTPNGETKGRLDEVGATALVEAGYAYWLGEVNYDAAVSPYGGDWMRDMISLIEGGYNGYGYAGWCHWGWMLVEDNPQEWGELVDWYGNPSQQGRILQEYL